jgi:hypothetical protein
MQTIVELPEYTKISDKLLNESESNSIINYLAAHPAAGKLMQGSGGIRKLRWSSQDREKVVVFELYIIIIINRCHYSC